MTGGIRHGSRGGSAAGGGTGRLGQHIGCAVSERESLLSDALCSYCGDLSWTFKQFGLLVHKHACPHREQPYCQSHPDGCGR